MREILKMKAANKETERANTNKTKTRGTGGGSGRGDGRMLSNGYRISVL